MEQMRGLGHVPDKEEVRKALREAFSFQASRPGLKGLTHAECVEMRTEIIALVPEDVPFFLWQILEDLLDTHTGEPGATEDAEFVVQFLDILGEGYCDAETLWALGIRHDEADARLLLDAKMNATANVTPEQACAICKWLEHALTWSDFAWDTEHIHAALAYWSRRFSTRDEEDQGQTTNCIDNS